MSVACSQVEVSVTGQSLVQRSPTGCGVSEWDLKTSLMMSPGPTRAVGTRKKKTSMRSLPCSLSLTFLKEICGMIFYKIYDSNALALIIETERIRRMVKLTILCFSHSSHCKIYKICCFTT